MHHSVGENVEGNEGKSRRLRQSKCIALLQHPTFFFPHLRVAPLLPSIYTPSMPTFLNQPSTSSSWAPPFTQVFFPLSTSTSLHPGIHVFSILLSLGNHVPPLVPLYSQVSIAPCLYPDTSTPILEYLEFCRCLNPWVPIYTHLSFSIPTLNHLPLPHHWVIPQCTHASMSALEHPISLASKCLRPSCTWQSRPLVK